MVRGLDIFRERFRDFEGSFVLIGGAACHEWFTKVGLAFRATKDLDIVLVVEVLDGAFVAAFRHFIDEGGYEIRERSEDGPPILYRFAKPSDERFPIMLELFSRRPDDIDLSGDQAIVPVPAGEDAHSLSAILLDENYYQLIRDHHDTADGLAVANATALIPMKANAWLRLTERKGIAEKVDAKDINKHRSDVFRLAATLPGDAGPNLSDSIREDLRRFLDAFPENSDQWPAILASIKGTVGGGLKPAALINALKSYFL